MSELPTLAPRSGKKNAARWLPLVFGLAIGLRAGLAMVHPFWLPDSADYDVLARAIVEHRPYEAGGLLAARMPGYPIFVAAIYAVCGYSVQAVLMVQALLSGGVVMLAYLIGRRAGVAVAWIAAGLAAIDPLSVGFSAAFLTESGFTFLMMLALWVETKLMEAGERDEGSDAGSLAALSATSMLRGRALSVAHPPRAWWLWLALGLLWGVGVYFRASALWCIVPCAVAVCLMSRGSAGRRWGGATAAIAIVFLLLAPWLIRNYHIFHSGLMRLTTLEGISLYEAVYPDADGGPKQDKIALPLDMQTLDEAERNDEWARRGWAYVWGDPGRILRLAVIKFGRTWSPWFNAEDFRNPIMQVVMIAWNVPLYIFGVIGLFSKLMPRRLKILLIIPLVYFSLIHALFLGSVRYRVPLMPIACIFAAAGIVTLIKRLSNQRSVAQSV